MADEIQIKAAGSTGSNPQIIDLRAAGGAGGAATGGSTSTTNIGGASGSSPKPARSGTISLVEEEDQFVMSGEKKYAIPAMVREKFPDLIKLIKETESMNDEEREYWFQILPIMTEEQIQKFRGILVNEKEQLARLDKEYEEELNKLNEKHMVEWKNFESKEKRKALSAAEEQAKISEKSQEEELLKRLSQA